MITDRTPRKAALRAEFSASDRLNSLELPADNRLTLLAQDIHAAMLSAKRTAVREASAEFLLAASEFYRVSRPEVRALTVRPLRVREGGWAAELFGDYSLGTALIRIWTRTPVRKQVTSFGTLLSTLCHEFCHHLDCQRFGFRHSPHTRGFYERAAALYHHAYGTPRKALFWIAMPGGRWRIDWRRMNAAFSSKRF
jgi:hypothetical protein